MSRWISVAAPGSLPEGEGKHVEVGDHVIAVFNLAGDFYAIDGACPHQGAPLAQGFLAADGVVTCPWHAWRFQVQDGSSPDGAALCVHSYAVRVAGGSIQVEVDD